MKKAIFGATAAAALLVGGAASATTVDIKLTEYSSVAEALAAQNAFIGTELAYEDFEGFCSYEASIEPDGCLVSSAKLAETDGGPVGGALVTNVGNMRSLKPINSTGDSSVEPQTDAVVRSATPEDDMFGRYDADRDTPAEDDKNNYLDSNDNGGIRLNIPGAAGFGMFNQVSFLLTDIDDVGAIEFSLYAGSSIVLNNSITANTLPNDFNPGDGGLFLATFFFSDFVDGTTIEARIDDGDGFGIDSISVSAVPLPASALLLLGGLGAMGAAARRKRKAA